MSQLLPLIVQIYVCACCGYERKHIIHMLYLITTNLFTFGAVNLF